MTVYNHYPTKEDLVFSKMEFFEERLIEAVESRQPGISVIEAFRASLLAASRGLASDETLGRIAEAADLIGASQSLQAREREIMARYSDRLAEKIAGETGAEPDHIEPHVVAEALMAVHHSILRYVRSQVLAGVRGRRLASAARLQTKQALAWLEGGLADYGRRQEGTRSHGENQGHRSAPSFARDRSD
jgi:AcrR family transcriptional regulator